MRNPVPVPYQALRRLSACRRRMAGALFALACAGGLAGASQIPAAVLIEAPSCHDWLQRHTSPMDHWVYGFLSASALKASLEKTGPVRVDPLRGTTREGLKAYITDYCRSELHSSVSIAAWNFFHARR